MQGWTCVTLNLLGRDIEGMSELEYDDDWPAGLARGAGPFPIGYTEENYEAKCSFTLFKEEMDALDAALPPGTRIQQLAPATLIAQYEQEDGSVKTDRINNLKINGRGVAVKNGDGTIVYKYPCTITHIDWNV